MIPGNPAVAAHYEEWIKEIGEVNTGLDIHYATSYTLFDRKLNDTDYVKVFAKHYEDLFLNFSKGDKVILLAHSVGSYFALMLLEKYPEKIEKVIIMFPYIGYSDFRSLRYVSIPYLLDRVFPLSELVSQFKILFGWRYKGVRDITTQELTACLRYGVRQCQSFNKSRFDIKDVSEYKDKIYFIYKESDKWCPQQTIELLKPISHSQKVGIPHDFIVSKENRDKMFEAVGPVLK
jgi:pimeloyl-ACP methyl ester carboxylesterase